MRPRTALGVLIAAGSLVSACAAEVRPELESRQRAILGGSISERDGVVFLLARAPDRTGSCSGVLVAPNVVLTARHCISADVEGTYSCTIDGDLDLSRPRSPANAGELGLVYAPELIEIYTGVIPDLDTPSALGSTIVVPETDSVCRNDIAFVVLDRELDASPLELLLDEPVLPRQLMIAAGYGVNEQRRTERVEVADVPVLDVGESDLYPSGGNAAPRTFVVGRSGCPGDSGGPVIDQESLRVAGVFSLARGDCTSSEVRNVVTQVAPFRVFAEEAFALAGHSELLDPSSGEPPRPGGEDPPGAPGGAGGAPSDGPSGAETTGGCEMARAGAWAAGTGVGRGLAWLIWLGGLLGLLTLRTYSQNGAESRRAARSGETARPRSR